MVTRRTRRAGGTLQHARCFIAPVLSTGQGANVRCSCSIGGGCGGSEWSIYVDRRSGVHPPMSVSLFQCLKAEEGGGGISASLLAFCCPCCPFGNITARIPRARYGETACCCAYACAAQVPGGDCVLQVLLRQKFHENVLREHESCCTSLALGMCCSCCGMVQMQKQQHMLARMAREHGSDTQSLVPHLPPADDSPFPDPQSLLPEPLAAYGSGACPPHQPVWEFEGPYAQNRMPP